MKKSARDRVLLVNSNTCQTPYPVYPLGIAHLCAALDAAGFETRTADLVSGDNLEQTIETFRPAIVGISLRNIDDIRIENPTFFVPPIMSLVQKIRALSYAKVIIGGSGFSLFPQRLLELSGADYGIAGEADLSLVQLLKELTSDDKNLKHANDIPGLVYRAEPGIRVNPQLSLSPSGILSAHHEKRLVTWYSSQSSMVNVQTQRGCPHRCCYCTYPLIEGSRMRHRSPEAVALELLDAKKQGARYFFVVDSVFNTSPDHVMAVCEALLHHGVALPWGCFLRPQELSAEMMALMSRAGLTHIEFGSDSYSDTVLAAYEKGLTFDDILVSSELAREAGIHHAHFLIVGGPSETAQTMRESFQNSSRLKRTVHFPFVGMRIYPGTRLYHRACAEGLINDNTDLLHPVFYVSARVQGTEAQRLLREFRAASPNWILDEPDEAVSRVIGWMRAKGIVGPLWEYLVR